MTRWVSLVFVCGVAGCGGPATLEEALQAEVDYTNRYGDEIMETRFGGVLKGTKVSARIENGDTVVVSMTNTPTGNTTLNPNVARKTLRDDFCDYASMRQIFEMGGKARVEITSNTGFKVPPIQVARC